MGIKVVIGASVIALFTAPVLPAQIDATALVRQSIQNYERDWREGMAWEYRQVDTTRSDGVTEVDTSEIVPLGGTPYERLVMKDGHSLIPEQQKREQRKYEKALRQREEETPEEREARIRKYEAERSFVKDIPDAYRYQLIGEDVVNGRPAWVVKMTPRPGFVPTAPHASMLSHIQGTLWIDKEDVQWAKAEAEVIDTIEIGWIMARIGPGARFTVSQERVADGLWMPSRITIQGAARVMLVHTKNLDEELTFSGYRKASPGQSAQAGGGIHPQTNAFRQTPR